MTPEQIKDYVLLAVALIPLAGNLLALILRRLGKHNAADWVVRMTPIAVVAASSKTREDAIKVVIREAASMSMRSSHQHLKAVAEDLGNEPSPSSAAKSTPPPPYATPGKPMPTDPKDAA